MRPETEARIRTVQKFGKNARQFCALVAAGLGILAFVSWATIFAGPRVAGVTIRLGGFYSVATDQLTTAPIKVWLFIVVTLVLGLFGWTLFHLHRLFKQLEAGSIYTQQNVYHLRQVGLLSMALAVIQLILPLLSFALVEIGFIDRALVTGSGNALVFGTSSFGGLITASLILLASWIMDVGRQISDDAEAMRREADLVI